MKAWVLKLIPLIIFLVAIALIVNLTSIFPLSIPLFTGKTMEVHYLDVGQGDAIFLRLPTNKTILIDGGSQGQGRQIVNYIKDLKIKKIDYLIASHPHEDHIGGLPEIIKDLSPNSIYMPKVEHNTESYRALLLACQEHSLKVIEAKAGLDLDCGRDIKAYFVAPNSSKYKEINDYSAVLYLEYGQHKFLFMADAEKVSEVEILARYPNLEADVLKVGHHGSRSSTSPDFLAQIKPSYAVISLGLDNPYGHPHIETIRSLKEKKINTYHTDYDGTIVFISNGQNLDISQNTKMTQNHSKYIGNRNSKVFHRPSCSNLPASKNRVDFQKREEALESGYSPCPHCQP